MSMGIIVRLVVHCEVSGARYEITEKNVLNKVRPFCTRSQNIGFFFNEVVNGLYFLLTVHSYQQKHF